MSKTFGERIKIRTDKILKTMTVPQIAQCDMLALNKEVIKELQEEDRVKEIVSVMKAIEGNHTVGTIVGLAVAVSNKIIEPRHRYSCGVERLEVGENGKAIGFFNSPDGQNGEFFRALLSVGCQRHFYKAEYHWGVRKGNIILTYTEGDLAVYVEPTKV
jgi:hypothetical protein